MEMETETNKNELTKMSLDNSFWSTLLLYFLSSANTSGCSSCPFKAMQMQGYSQPPIYININSNNVTDKEENKTNA